MDAQGLAQLVKEMAMGNWVSKGSEVRKNRESMSRVRLEKDCEPQPREMRISGLDSEKIPSQPRASTSGQEMKNGGGGPSAGDGS